MEAQMEQTTTAGGGSELADKIQALATTTPETAAPASTPSSPEKTSGFPAAITPAVPVAPAAPAFTPNFKFKVRNEEREIDEWARAAMKDADSEKKVREIFEKAYGVDYMKPKFDGLEKDLGQYKDAYTNLHADTTEAMTYKNNGDLDSFFDKVSLSKEKVYEWVLNKVERQNLPPEQQKVYNELDAKKRDEYHQSRKIDDIEKRYQHIATQAREAEVNSVLARNDISQIVQSYDAKNGEGSFKAFVAEYGVMHFNVHGEDPSAETAIQAVLKRVGDAYRGQPASNSAPANGEKQLPIIPNVSGKNVSPTRKAPKSIDDLRKMGQEMSA